MFLCTPSMNNYIFHFCFVVGNDSQLYCNIYIITFDFLERAYASTWTIWDSNRHLLQGFSLLHQSDLRNLSWAREILNRFWLQGSNQTQKEELSRGLVPDTRQTNIKLIILGPSRWSLYNTTQYVWASYNFYVFNMPVYLSTHNVIIFLFSCSHCQFSAWLQITDLWFP